MCSERTATGLTLWAASCHGALVVPTAQPPPNALSRAQVNDVLSYWLSALRLEEALKARPTARHPGQSEERNVRPRLDVPTPGQDYFKVTMDEAFAGLLTDKEPYTKPFDAELTGFFETWLHAQYRRGEEEGELSHLLCFPVVHLPRGELAGVLRRPVRLRFRSAEKSFSVPSRADRQRGVFPDPPSEASIQAAPVAEGGFPFFVDTRLLRHPLGVAGEEIDAFFEALRAKESVSELEMLSLFVQMLEASLKEEAVLHGASRALSEEVLLGRLTHAVRALLARGPSRAQVYPVGIVLDGTQARTTWHLQRELTGLLDGEPRLSLETPLGAYLSQRPLQTPDAFACQRALGSGPKLTHNQRAIAEQFWCSPLTAVQGPPGTGKTTLILHLCSEAIARQVDALVDRGSMDDAMLVVVSSNNRAVDNVIEPLSEHEGLPLALRAGSRQVCEHQLTAQLRRAWSFLDQAERLSAEEREAALQVAQSEFRACRETIERLHAPRRAFLMSAQERAACARALSELVEPVFDAKIEPLALPEPEARALGSALSALELRLQALSELCEAKPGLLQVNAVARHYGRTADKALPAFEAALSAVGLSLDLPLPPLVVPMDPPALMEVWQEATESALHQLSALRERLEREQKSAAFRWEKQRLHARLTELGEAEGGVPAPPEHETESRAFFAAAIKVREAWARREASKLKLAVSAAISALEEQRSLRPIFRDQPEHARRLRQLFCVWGSTLLSLGNCFPAEGELFSRVVIDEAGQCHPAHAVSALLRSEAGMVIGDVHQLAPVIEVEPDDEVRLMAGYGARAATVLAPFRVHSRSQVSTQALADGAVASRAALIDHFRCQSDIIAVSDALCGYGLTVRTQPMSRGAEAPFLAAQRLLMSVQGEQQRRAGSLCNEVENQATLALVQALLSSGIAPEDLAIITPYRGQLELLRRGLYDLRVPIEMSVELREADGPAPRAQAGVALGTVHRFQGGERSIVLFSSVVSEVGSLPFLNQRPNLLNVAVSRAQHHFVCVGHRATLLHGVRSRLLVEGAKPLVLQRSGQA